MKRRRQIRQYCLVVVVLLSVFLSLSVPVSADIIPIDSERWTHANGRVVEHLGRTSFMFIAFLHDVDMTVTGQRSNPGVNFRIQSRFDYERMYRRPHQAGSIDNVSIAFCPIPHSTSGERGRIVNEFVNRVKPFFNVEQGV